MNSATIAGALVTLVLLGLAGNHAALEAEEASQGSQGFLYGRVVGVDGATYEGRLRFGGDEEAFWGHYFNGFKDENPWATYLPRDHPAHRRPIKIFGFEIPFGQGQIDLGRPLMARFGDIARIEASGRDLKVTLKSGTVFALDRFAADDFADGVRVWDARRGVVDLDEWRIRSIELLPTAGLEAAPGRLHGTVRTGHGNFTGFIQWNREQCAGSDELSGHSADGDVRLRFDTIRAIARAPGDAALVTLRDGREIVLSDTAREHRGIYVDDRRYGRVLVSWEAFQGLDFSASASGSGPAYSDFPPGRALTGRVTTRAGRRLAGRLVYDLDESETTETLDAPLWGVDYTIPLGLIASISLDSRDGRARVTLHDGEALQLERTGDLGAGNAGMLIFVDGREHPEYVPWPDVEQIEFD